MSLEKAFEDLQRALSHVLEEARRDTLGPLLNSFALEHDLARMGDAEMDVVVFGDLNGFKRINDQHGHHIGDLAIQRAARELEAATRGAGLDEKLVRAYRKHGDEFVILCNGKVLDLILKGLSSRFSGTPFFVPSAAGPVELTIRMSFGWSGTDSAQHANDVLKNAELACRVAKTQGDGRAVEWSRELPGAKESFRARCSSCSCSFSADHPLLTASSSLHCPHCGARNG